MKRDQVNFWSAFSVYPPVVLGLAAAMILALEGNVFQVMYVLVLVATDRYSAVLLNRSNLPVDERADWMAVRVLTTVCCLALPFYLAFTIH